MKKIKVTSVVKNSGKKEAFKWEKISQSVILAGQDTKAFNRRQAQNILAKINLALSKIKKTTLKTSEIRDIVEPAIAEAGYFNSARYYILYKERSQKKKLSIWEPSMSENARLTLISRCAQHDSKGTPLETPGQIFSRVARHIAKAEINWGDEKDVEKVALDFFQKMANFKFICTRSALYEAGNPDCSQQLSPCFVLKIEDSITSIFKTLGEAALVQKNYGGTGFNFSAIRHKGDRVRNVPNAASGPVDFLQVYSAALSKIMQGAKRHGGNMGILDINHPDIFDFIHIKDADGNLKNFNLSVGVTTEFMEAVIGNKNFNLVNPRDNQVVKTVKAKKLFDEICQHAWTSGDPGMIFLDRMEEDNPTPTLGKLNATNPCGEQPLLPYESCNLSSIHLANHLIKKKNQYEIDWEELGDTTQVLARFLDDMIQVNNYVLPETEKLVKHGNRKIGLGLIGFAETLFKLGIPYNSKEGVRLAERIAKFIKRQAEEASLSLAQTRGTFPNWDISTFKGTAEKYRNCTMITIAPTGTVSMIGNTTSGIEPCFALVYERRSFYNEDAKNKSTTSLYYLDPTFESVLKQKRLYSQALISEIVKNHGSIQSIKKIPAALRKIFVTAHDIDPEYHVRVQAAFQKYADNAVSKTINFPSSATPADIKKAYLLAWKLGCKGITIYRDQSRQDQVLNTGNTKSTTCPECGGTLIHEAGCATCRDCGWSVCKT